MHGARFWFAPTLFWFGSSDRALMLCRWVGAHRVAARDPQSVAAAVAARLFCLLSFVRLLGAGFRRLSIRRNAARSRFPGAVFRSARIAPRPRRVQPAFARESVSFEMGMVLHLFRIGHRENRERRSILAPPHRARRLLPERPAAHMARLVRAKICRTAFTPRRCSSRSSQSFCSSGCFFCRAAFASPASASLRPFSSASCSPQTTRSSIICCSRSASCCSTTA